MYNRTAAVARAERALHAFFVRVAPRYGDAWEARDLAPRDADEFTRLSDALGDALDDAQQALDRYEAAIG